MKIKSPLPKRRARLEIIPLIDIMFFLLASFMMVALQMQKVRTLKASLPTATLANPNARPELVRLAVDGAGQVSIDDRAVAIAELSPLLHARAAANAQLAVLISGTEDATHGSMIYVLDLVKRAGVAQVAVAIQPLPPTAVR